MNTYAGTIDEKHGLGGESNPKNASFILLRGLFTSAEWKTLDYRPVSSNFN